VRVCGRTFPQRMMYCGIATNHTCPSRHDRIHNRHKEKNIYIFCAQGQSKRVCEEFALDSVSTAAVPGSMACLREEARVYMRGAGSRGLILAFQAQAGAVHCVRAKQLVHCRQTMLANWYPATGSLINQSRLPRCEASELHAGCSAKYLDGKLRVVLGASWATHLTDCRVTQLQELVSDLTTHLCFPDSEYVCERSEADGLQRRDRCLETFFLSRNAT